MVLMMAGLIFYQCSESFLEIPAQNSLDGQTLANQDGVEASLISAYAMLDGWNNDWGQVNPPWPAAGSNWIFGGVTSDEAYKGSEPGDQAEIQLLELYQWAPGNEYFNIKYRVLYEGVARTNATINLKNSVEDIQEGDRIEGEARFLRAHFHFDLWKLYKNVAFIDETVEEFRQPNNVDILPRVIDDFTFAMNNLPAVQSAPGRATSGAATAYLGKVAMFQKDFLAAKGYFDAVVNSGTYELQENFHHIFTTEGENGPEMIFTIQGSVNDGSGDGANGLFSDRLNHPHGGSPFGCCGFFQPSYNLVNSHKVDGNGLPMFDTFNNAILTDSDVVDPRLDWTVGRDGVPFLDWGIHEPDWIRARSWAGPFSSKKFIHKSTETHSSGWSSAQLSPLNIPIIRYADVLLMLAEAEVELDNLERARELVNMIRTRAAVVAIGPDGSPVPINHPGITWATYDVGTYDTPWTDQAAARRAVRFERKIELAQEGHRLFDMRRWEGTDFNFVDYMNNVYLAVEETRTQYLTEATVEPRHLLFPLPSPQILLSAMDGVEQLVQNDGY